MNSAILFMVFNRPNTTKRVFNAIRQAKPLRLYVAADGPRENKLGEKEKCAEVKEVITNVDWDCEVKTLFREKNMGCGKAVSEAITWFFENEEEGIILEDDCLPNSTFFLYCDSLLEKYRYDDRIMMINGTNLTLGMFNIEDSYYFSRASLIWGWATWRRAWGKYDFTLKKYQNGDISNLNKWNNFLFRQMLNKKIDTWDYQWFFTLWFNEGICITPKVNLIKNIGYGTESTHAFLEQWWVKKLVYGEIKNIIHPTKIEINKEADNFVFNKVQSNNVILNRIKKVIKPYVFKVLNLISNK